MRRPIKLLYALAVVIAVVIALRLALPKGEGANAAGNDGRQQSASSDSAAKNRGGGAKDAAPRGPTPVLAGVAKAEDFPVIVRGIGNVSAVNEVQVKSRVDGNITRILYREGQMVHAGDPLVQIDPRPYQAQLDQARANQAKDQANLDNARRDLARVAALVQTQLAATQQQYETQKALVAQLEASVKADQAAVETAQLNIEYSTLKSPIDGVVGLQLVAIGNLVTAGVATPLVDITQVQPIGLVFTIPERELNRIREAAAQHSLKVLAFDGDDKRQLSEGALAVINNQVDQATGTITLKAIFPNADTALWPGQFVNAHLVLNVVPEAVTVPVAAVQMGPNGSFVYAVKPDSTVEARPVTVGQVEGRTALIEKGLASGDRIVVSGQNGLSPGLKVAIRDGAPGEANAREPQIGPEGVGSTGITTAPPGAGGIDPR